MREREPANDDRTARCGGGGAGRQVTGGPIPGRQAATRGQAQAAAVYNALYGDEPGQLGMDIIAQPQFRVETTRVPILARQSCASVVGYRANEGDWLVNLKKVRRPLEQFVTEVK